MNSNTFDPSPRKLSTKDFISELLKYIILGGLMAFLFAKVIENVEFVHDEVRHSFYKVAKAVCGTIDVGDFCDPISNDDGWISDELSRMPSLKAAFDSLKWNNGDKIDAVKFTAIVRGLQFVRWNDYGTNQPWSHSKRALEPIFNKYPTIAVGSQCYWCSNHDSNMYEWFTASRQHDEYLSSLVETTPHLFGQFAKTLRLDSDRVLALARNQSYLAYHGNRYGFLGKVLHSVDDKKHLHVLVKNTGSAAPIMGLDWDTIDFQTVVKSWEQGVRVGDDLPQFTEYLLRKGYRPALRWLIWVHSEGQQNPYLGRMRRSLRGYENLVRKYLDFDLATGERLEGFYSKHYQQIRWNPSSSKWQLTAL